MKAMVWCVCIIAIIVTHILNIKYQWMMIRANSTYFFIVDVCIVYIIYVISLGTKNENAVTQSLQWIPHFWYLTVVIYYIL